MKIDKIIKEKRIESNMTQEQVANYLGVSTPAVNKWEKGNSYPDITLLPPIARLLKIDLNTLFSFHEDLTKREICAFAEELMAQGDTLGYDEIFEQAMTKIHKYPTCGELIIHLAVSLESGLLRFNVNDKVEYEKKINKLYEDCACSDDAKVKKTAIFMLISSNIHRENYDKAQSYIDKMKDGTDDKINYQADLYVKSKEYEKALEIYENRLMNSTMEVIVSLFTLMEIALKEKRFEDAKCYAGIIEKPTNLFEGVGGFNSQSAYFDLYSELKDEQNLLDTMEKFLLEANTEWDISKTVLYKHIKPTTINPDAISHSEFFTCILEMFKDDKLDFIKNHPRFISLLEKYTI